MEEVERVSWLIGRNLTTPLLDPTLWSPVFQTVSG